MKLNNPLPDSTTSNEAHSAPFETSLASADVRREELFFEDNVSVDTETTVYTSVRRTHGLVCYDRDCPWCRTLVLRLAPGLRRHGFRVAPLQSSRVKRLLTLPDDFALHEMKVLTSDGRILGGADGVLEVARNFPWAGPLVFICRRGWGRVLCGRLYQTIASLRPCCRGACRNRALGTRSISIWDGWPLFLLPLLAVMATWQRAGWFQMWSMAVALWIGFKWLTLRDAGFTFLITPLPRTLGYLFAWPGMDARAFLAMRPGSDLSSRREWWMALAGIVAGMALVWRLVAILVPTHPMAAGWTGMTGLVLFLHFGLFHLVALLWQAAGVDAEPLMQHPARAASIAEFWGRRWNTGFSVLARRFLFRPLVPWLGPGGATLAVFVVSGVIHELVITIPARGGYGLPTTYFLFQGAAPTFERTPLAHRWGLGRGLRGWAFTLACTVGPVCLLFPPVFIGDVILPFLRCIGAF